jgi:hypothetical protein
MSHSMATHLLDAGEPIDFVQDHHGHRNIESSLVYARVSDRRRTNDQQARAIPRDCAAGLNTAAPLSSATPLHHPPFLTFQWQQLEAIVPPVAASLPLFLPKSDACHSELRQVRLSFA